ncbi:hypothetical protein BGW80DRAFT_154896 [Lactifluus volemus]|nr:hypothetical protein BGW80DRAFT_154896 [Lactifluus volemus]
MPTSEIILSSTVNSSTKGTVIGSSRSRASSLRSFNTVPRTPGPERSPGVVSPSSVRTVSPLSSDVAAFFPSASQRGRFKIVPVNDASGANSLPKSHDSERFHSLEPGKQIYLNEQYTNPLSNEFKNVCLCAGRVRPRQSQYWHTLHRLLHLPSLNLRRTSPLERGSSPTFIAECVGETLVASLRQRCADTFSATSVSHLRL